MKRDWNLSADRLESESLQREKGPVVSFDQRIEDLITLNRMKEFLMLNLADPVVKVAVATT